LIFIDQIFGHDNDQIFGDIQDRYSEESMACGRTATQLTKILVIN